MDKLIYPCIWCNDNAVEMAEKYLSIFPESAIVDVNPWVVVITCHGQPPHDCRA